MDVYEITGYKTAISKEGVNFLEPVDSFQDISNGYIYRQVLQSRPGFVQFSTGPLSNGTRVMGIFEFVKPNNEKALLAIDKNFLYEYNSGTNTFDQIPMAGSAPVGGFGISSNNEYVSGTAYPFSDNSERFVFTGKGMANTYFYDGTDVKVFTNVVDNPDYQAPAGGALTNATHVIWFGERLNLFAPVIGGILQSQMTLYSGIRDSSGNGDKFNVPGSGSLSADTSESLNGAKIRGNTLTLNFSRSNWTIEKTRDAFNPYFIRKIPGVVGTDASFSPVEWSDQVRSIGKTGIISTDGRETLRVDNKIPHFTTDTIAQGDIDLTYGGFDRANAQFLFAYRNAESSIADTQDKVLVSNYEENTWSIYDQRFSCFGQTDAGQNLTWDDIYEVNNPAWKKWDTTLEIWDRIGLGDSYEKTLAGDNLGFIYELNVDYDDYVFNITDITKASHAVITVGTHPFRIGDVVSIHDVSGMTQINDENRSKYSTVRAITATKITVNINSSQFSTYTSGGIISKVINFYAETIPFNPYRSQGRKCFVSHVEFLLDTDGGHLLVDVYEDEEEAPFKSNVLLQPSDETTKAREWITMSVNQEANFLTFALKQQAASVQVRLTSMRIHCEAGALTST